MTVYFTGAKVTVVFWWALDLSPGIRHVPSDYKKNCIVPPRTTLLIKSQEAEDELGDMEHPLALYHLYDLSPPLGPRH